MKKTLMTNKAILTFTYEVNREDENINIFILNGLFHGHPITNKRMFCSIKMFPVILFQLGLDENQAIDIIEESDLLDYFCD